MTTGAADAVPENHAGGNTHKAVPPASTSCAWMAIQGFCCFQQGKLQVAHWCGTKYHSIEAVHPYYAPLLCAPIGGPVVAPVGGPFAAMPPGVGLTPMLPSTTAAGLSPGPTLLIGGLAAARTYNTVTAMVNACGMHSAGLHNSVRSCGLLRMLRKIVAALTCAGFKHVLVLMPPALTYCK
jgi:hypothetical protein